MSKPIHGIKEENWQKHLRPFNKKVFWRKVRRKFKHMLGVA